MGCTSRTSPSYRYRCQPIGALASRIWALYAARVSKAPDVHLNLNVRGVGNSATVAINERSNALLAEGHSIIKLGLGQSPFPVPATVVEALQANAHQKDYLPVRGLFELRNAVADYHRRRNGIEREGQDVIIGPGSKELMFLLQLVFYGDLVIPTPSWVSYAPQARIIGRQVRFIPTRAEDGWRLSPRGLELLCREDPGRPRILILNYPSNPTGRTYGVDELQELAAVARKHRVVLLSDEIYGELHHEGAHTSIAEFYPEGTIVSSGLSKWCGAGGWRLGTFVFPRQMHWLLEAMAAVASETYTSTSAPIQYAAVAAFVGGPELDDYLLRSRHVLKALGRFVAARLRQAEIDCPDPDGAFYLFPSFKAHRDCLRARGIKTGRDMVARLLDETGVAVLPGSDFGRPDRELSCRLAYVDFDGAAALAAADPSTELEESRLRELCPRVIDGIERMCEWVETGSTSRGRAAE